MVTTTQTANAFKVRAYTETMWREGEAYKFGRRTRYKLHRYEGTGTSHVTEGWMDGGNGWQTIEDTQAAADRANAGDEAGIRFASYSDD